MKLTVWCKHDYHSAHSMKDGRLMTDATWSQADSYCTEAETVDAVEISWCAEHDSPMDEECHRFWGLSNHYMNTGEDDSDDYGQPTTPRIHGCRQETPARHFVLVDRGDTA